MAVGEQQDLAQYCREMAERSKKASTELVDVLGETKNQWLRESAARLRASSEDVLEANAKDLARAPDFGLTEAQIDRLKLDDSRIESIAVGLEEVASLPDPVGEVIDSSRRPNGLDVSRVRVPLGCLLYTSDAADE